MKHRYGSLVVYLFYTFDGKCCFATHYRAMYHKSISDTVYDYSH
uniref:Uncharacterized protein n=1 Tax=Rhizophora mucronata TaxID=61149 RepID=A0A2P2LKA3_RHIMU